MRNLIFDLDGTLVDSLAGIEHSVRLAVAEVLPATTAMPSLRSVIGPPISVMFARMWPDLPSSTIQRLLASFRSHYAAQGCLRTTPFPGVPETLLGLSSYGFRHFVLTNKPAKPTEKILAHLGIERFFVAALSPDSIEPPFPSKPAAACYLAEKFALDPKNTTVIGDGLDDAAAADACQFSFIAAAYGYGTAAETAERKAEKFSDIQTLLI